MTMPTEPREIHRADPRARRALAVILVVACVLAVVLHAVVMPWIQGWLHGSAAATPPVALTVLRLSIWLAAGTTLVIGLWVWRTGSRVVGAQRFPLAGARVVRDVPVRRGAAAIRLGRWVQVAAAVLIVCALLLGWVGHRLLAILERAAG